jgi:hypothetical protein
VALLDRRSSERGPLERALRVLDRDVLRPEEDLDATRLRLFALPARERDADRPEPNPLGRHLADHEVRGSEEGRDELRLRPLVQLARRTGFEQAAGSS